MRSPFSTSPSVMTFALLTSLLGGGSVRSFGQMGMAPAPQAQGSTPQDTQAQITQLRAQVAQLQAALQQGPMKKPVSGNPMPATKPGMGMPMGDTGEMGGMSGAAAKPPMAPMKDDGGEMAGMAPSAPAMKAGSAKPMGGMGCCGMSMGKPMPMPAGSSAKPSGSMAPMSRKSMPTTNVSESPHLLHIGATDFFLDHATHLMLSADQRTSLQAIKSSATEQKAASQKQVDQAQQELWQLTSAAQPDGGQIDSKVQQIAALNANEQIAFIHSVAASTAVLTADQQERVMTSPTPTPKMKPRLAKTPMAPMKM